jgi:putative transposase
MSLSSNSLTACIVQAFRFPDLDELIQKPSACDTRHNPFIRKDVKIRIRARLSGVPNARSKKEPASAAAVMAIPRRHAHPSHVVAHARTFFITSSISGKRNLLQSDRSAALFVDVLYNYRGQGKFRLHEFVVMPDHFHLLLTVESDSTIERAVQFIKGGFAFRAGKELRLDTPLWQKGFSEVRVMDSGAFATIRDYIRNNPIAKNLVCEAARFPYSSANPRYELDPKPQGLKPKLSGDLNGTAETIP